MIPDNQLMKRLATVRRAARNAHDKDLRRMWRQHEQYFLRQYSTARTATKTARTASLLGKNVKICAFLSWHKASLLGKNVKICAFLFFALLANEAWPTDLPDEQRCMAEAMYYEARDQGTMGMVAVAAVVKNRIKSTVYPDTACGVVRQGKKWRGVPIRNKCQFSYFCDGKPERPTEKEAWKRAMQIARALVGTDFKVTGLEKATHYHATNVTPSWTTDLRLCRRVGDHLFYAEQ